MEAAAALYLLRVLDASQALPLQLLCACRKPVISLVYRRNLQ